jgi:hypothetical protein
MSREVHSSPMTIMLDDSLLETIDNLRKFVDGSLPITFRPLKRKERSQWIRHTLVRFTYLTLKRADKQVVRQYIIKISSLSRAQVGRHIKAYKDNKPICVAYVRRRFSITFTQGDIELLAETDNLHQRLNGAATIAIMEEEHDRGDHRYERLKNISVAHLYRLRKTERYTMRSTTHEKTQSVQTPIGERRKPQPNGKPGYLRTDSVHQGDCNGKKGVYHINNVDEVTQWEVPVAVENLQEVCVEPALDDAFPLFPFVIKNFHSDNGGEYINGVVQQFLKRWNAKQTKSRPYHSNDNGLAETKNGAVIRKHMTHYHIPQPFAARINHFYRDHLIPYLNFHRPCAFPEVVALSNGKKKITYPQKNYMTPYEKLKSLPDWEQYLRLGVTPKMLEEQARAKTPNQAARDMQKAKKKLFDIVLPKHRDML